VSRSARAACPLFGVDHRRRIEHLGDDGTLSWGDATALTGSGVDTASGLPISPETEAVRFLTAYEELVRRTPPLEKPELRQLVAAHVRDLMALAHGTVSHVNEIAQRRSLRAARLDAIKADILAHLGARALSLEAVAKRQGISPIYVRKLFESEDTSFTQFVLGERLARAHRLLRDPRLTESTIAALALDAGFGDLPYFNRAFRRRYGVTPSDVRPTGQT